MGIGHIVCHTCEIHGIGNDESLVQDTWSCCVTFENSRGNMMIILTNGKLFFYLTFITISV